MWMEDNNKKRRKRREEDQVVMFEFVKSTNEGSSHYN